MLGGWGRFGVFGVGTAEDTEGHRDGEEG